MEFKSLLNLETIGWLLFACGWLSQVYMAYGKRSTRTGKTSLVLMLTASVVLVVSSFVDVRSISSLVIVRGIVALLVWMVYVRRR